MPQYQVKFSETVNAPREKVFAFFADHEKFATLLGIRARRTKDGSDPTEPNGLGSVRLIGPGPLAFDETIIGFNKPESIQYSTTRGGPLKNHLGNIEFIDHGTTTQVEYVIRFDTKVPFTGKLIEHGLSLSWKLNAPKILAKLGN